MSNKRNSSWSISLSSWGAFILSLILYYIFNLNVTFVLGMLTAAIIVTIGNTIYVLYQKYKIKKPDS